MASRAPPTLLVVAAIFAAYALMNVHAAWRFNSPLFLFWTLVCGTASFGLVRARPWSRYLVYLACALLLGGWCVYVVMLWDRLDAVAIEKLLMLGIGLTVFCGASWLAVWRFFRAKKRMPITPPALPLATPGLPTAQD